MISFSHNYKDMASEDILVYVLLQRISRKNKLSRQKHELMYDALQRQWT